MWQACVHPSVFMVNGSSDDPMYLPRPVCHRHKQAPVEINYPDNSPARRPATLQTSHWLIFREKYEQQTFSIRIYTSTRIYRSTEHESTTLKMHKYFAICKRCTDFQTRILLCDTDVFLIVESELSRDGIGCTN